MRSRKTTIMAFSIALAMILSYVESQIPTLIPIPGVKLGLANIVVVFVLYKLGFKFAIVISLVRVLLLAIMFGNLVSLLYSISGAILSLASMVILMKTKLFSHVAVSVTGGVMHNVGQILTACVVMGVDLIRYYFPYLLVSGVASGIAIGLLASIMVKRIEVKMVI